MKMASYTDLRTKAQLVERIGRWAAVAAVVALGLSACNTTEGVGKDIESAGAGIEEAASDAKN